MTNESLFSGVKVLDIASFIAAPASTTVLSDFGADVVKVERSGMGDPHRYTYLSLPNPPSEENYAWQLANRNKRGLVPDLKHLHAAEVLVRLVKWADVLVTNFPPHVRKRPRSNYDDVSPLNPRLICADITGYGEVGRKRTSPGSTLRRIWRVRG